MNSNRSAMYNKEARRQSLPQRVHPQPPKLYNVVRRNPSKMALDKTLKLVWRA